MEHCLINYLIVSHDSVPDYRFLQSRMVVEEMSIFIAKVVLRDAQE